jgi:hypothetical protein
MRSTYFLTCPFGQLTKKSTCPTQSFSCPKKKKKITKMRIIISNLCKMFWLLSRKHYRILVNPTTMRTRLKMALGCTEGKHVFSVGSKFLLSISKINCDNTQLEDCTVSWYWKKNAETSVPVLLYFICIGLK